MKCRKNQYVGYNIQIIFYIRTNIQYNTLVKNLNSKNKFFIKNHLINGKEHKRNVSLL